MGKSNNEYTIESLIGEKARMKKRVSDVNSEISSKTKELETFQKKIEKLNKDLPKVSKEADAALDAWLEVLRPLVEKEKELDAAKKKKPVDKAKVKRIQGEIATMEKKSSKAATKYNDALNGHFDIYNFLFNVHVSLSPA